MNAQQLPREACNTPTDGFRRTLRHIGRAAHALSLGLALLTPAWDEGLFAILPIATLHLGERSYKVGLLSLLPLVAAMLWGATHPLPPKEWGSSTRTSRRKELRRWLPLLILSILVLVRIWPVHQPRRAATAVLAVALLWGGSFLAYHNLTPRWLLASLMFVLLVQGALATLQFLKQSSLGIYSLGEMSMTPDTQGASVIEAADRRWLRAYGLTPHPNILGGYLSLALLTCLGMRGQVAARRGRPSFHILAALALVIGAAGLFFSFSRSAWIGTCVGLLYLGLVLKPWRRIAREAPRSRYLLPLVGGIAVGAIITLGTLCGELLLSRLRAPLEQTSIRERLEEMRQAWVLIRARPLLGVGPGYYIDALWAAIGNFMGPNYPGFRVVHNLYLLSAAELGIPGALLTLWFLITPPLTVWQRSRQREISPTAAGVAAAFLAAAITGCVDYYRYIPVTWWPPLMLGTLAGAWVRIMTISGDVPSPDGNEVA
mgnify:FL=1